MTRAECCRLLGIATDAEQDEIKSAYRKLVRACHPDLNPELANSSERLIEINRAYEFLSNQASADREERLSQLLSQPWHAGWRSAAPPRIASRRRSSILPCVLVFAVMLILLFVIFGGTVITPYQPVHHSEPVGRVVQVWAPDGASVWVVVDHRQSGGAVYYIPTPQQSH